MSTIKIDLWFCFLLGVTTILFAVGVLPWWAPVLVLVSQVKAELTLERR